MPQPPTSAIVNAAPNDISDSSRQTKYHDQQDHRNNRLLNHENYTKVDHRSLQFPCFDCCDHQEADVNDIMGTEICGILNKWVNYGKGWRPRLFVLQRDGVLSYYKIHGRHESVFIPDTDKGTRIIGQQSLCRISGNKNASSQLRHNPDGEVHLKVSSIHESRSDDKRFSIFTGTKRLHLRANTHEDQIAWVETLQTVKGMFPRISNSELLAPLDNITVSTDQLRQRLLEEGVSEVAIQDCEQIMKNEFSALQNQLMLLKRKYWLLIDTLQQLEVHLMISEKHHANGMQNSYLVSSSRNSV